MEVNMEKKKVPKKTLSTPSKTEDKLHRAKSPGYSPPPLAGSTSLFIIYNLNKLLNQSNWEDG
jgi:hypothetical protein